LFKLFLVIRRAINNNSYALINMLSKEQRQRLEQEKNSLKEVYSLQSQKIEEIRKAFYIETDPSRKFQYKEQIKQEEEELKKLSDRLDEIEKKVQSVDNLSIKKEIKTTQQKKILILTAIPYGLRLDKEIREIEEAIRRASNRDLFEICIRTAVRPQDIRRAIAEEQPEIVHFCGHGSKNGSLLLEDEGGNNKLISPEALASLFKLHVNYVKCVLLNACYSEQPAVAISRYIDYAIGMNKPIQDRTAIEFAKGFYDGLSYKVSSNQDVFKRAFDEAMVALQMEDLLDGPIPVLWEKGITQTLQEDYSQNSKYQLVYTSINQVDTVTRSKADNWRCINTLTDHSDTVNCVAISPDGQNLVSGSADKTIKIWNLKTGRQLHTLEGHSDKVNCVVISPDGQNLVSGSADRTIKIWNLNTGKQIRSLGGWFSAHLDSICSLAITPDAQTIISGSRDHTIKLWNFSTGRQTGELSQHSWGVYSVAVTSDGQAIASDCLDHTIKLCRWDTEELLQNFLDHSDWIWAIAISPNGKILASGSQDCTVKLWNLETGKLLHTLTEHSNPVHSVSFNWDSQILASGSYDNTIKLWSVENWQLIHTLTEHEDGVNSIAFSPDGRIIASASDDKTIKIWQG
jgi:tetrahydromethanopterin S-methyltransferase subunit G